MQQLCCQKFFSLVFFCSQAYHKPSQLMSALYHCRFLFFPLICMQYSSLCVIHELIFDKCIVYPITIMIRTVSSLHKLSFEVSHSHWSVLVPVAFWSDFSHLAKCIWHLHTYISLLCSFILLDSIPLYWM